MNECIEIVADRLESGKGKWYWQVVINLAIIDNQTLFGSITFWQCYTRWFIVPLLCSRTANQNDYFCAVLFTFSLSL